MQDDEPMNDDNGGEQQGSSHTPRRSSRRKVPKSQYSPEELQKEGESKERMISTLGEAWKEDELRKFVRSFDKRFDRQSWEIDWRDVAADVGNGRTEENVLSLFKAHQSFLLDSDLNIDEKADKFPQSHHDLFQNVQLLSLLSESPANEKKATPKKNSTPKRTPKVCVNCFTDFLQRKTTPKNDVVRTPPTRKSSRKRLSFSDDGDAPAEPFASSPGRATKRVRGNDKEPSTPKSPATPVKMSNMYRSRRKQDVYV
jgi:hypothetical protein